MFMPELEGLTPEELIKIFLKEPPEDHREYAVSNYSEVVYQLAKLSPELSKDFFLESKDSMKRRGIASPDLADALTLACYPDGWLGGGAAWAVAL